MARRRYALFTDDVLKEDIYKVTTPPKRFFKTKRIAKKYVKKRFGTADGINIWRYK